LFDAKAGIKREQDKGVIVALEVKPVLARQFGFCFNNTRPYVHPLVLSSIILPKCVTVTELQRSAAIWKVGLWKYDVTVT
jgi:hypothetical protein